MIATDVHAISDLNDPYNADFMRAADVLLISGEWLPVEPEEWARRVWNRYRAEVLVISLGGEGVLLAQKKQQSIVRIPAVPVRKAGNTIEGGDALFSAFVHYYAKTCDAKLALHKSMVFASYAIGEAPAANTLLNEAELDSLYDEMGRSW